LLSNPGEFFTQQLGAQATTRPSALRSMLDERVGDNALIDARLLIQVLKPGHPTFILRIVDDGFALVDQNLKTSALLFAFSFMQTNLMSCQPGLLG
jgi:hypothetical protein